MENENKFGFTNFAETWNGRLAMLGFVIAVATELLTVKIDLRNNINKYLPMPPLLALLPLLAPTYQFNIDRLVPL